MSQDIVLDDVLSRVSESMGIEYVNPQYSYSPNRGGECNFNSFRQDPNGRIFVEEAEFLIPESIRGNELAIEGYFAHESGHVRLLNDRGHSRYLRMRALSEKGGLLATIYTWMVYNSEEKRVDMVASTAGHKEAIDEVRKHIKNVIVIHLS